MSQAELVRLVRCPKCQNLLTELAGYSVYQCGGCGAVLRAKLKQDEHVLAEKSDDEKSRVYGKACDLSVKQVPETLKKSADNNNGSDCNEFASIEKNGVNMNKYPNLQPVSNNEPIDKVDPHASVAFGKIEKHSNSFGNVSRPPESECRSRCLREISGGQYGSVVDGNEGGRSLQLKDQEDGPSVFISDSSCSNGNPGEDMNGLNWSRNNGDLPIDRAELLQMMEELSHQLRRSGNLEKMKVKGPMNQNAAANRGCNGSSISGMFDNKVAGPSAGMHEFLMPEKPTISPYHDPRYLPHYSPYSSRQRNGVSNPHHFPNSPSDMHGYGNNFEMPVIRGTLPTPSHFEHQFLHPSYYPEHPFADDPSINGFNSNNGLPHHHVCGFYNCCSDQHRATQLDYQDDSRFFDVQNNPISYPRNLPSSSAQRRYCRKTSGLSSSHIDHSVQTRMTDKDMRFCTRGYVRQQQQKGKVTKVGLHCQPKASGAPFIICQDCSNLLQLPKMTFKYNSKRQVLCCGACNTVMFCALINKKFTISVSGESKKILKGVSPYLDDSAREGNSSEFGWAKMNIDDFYSSSHDSTGINGNTHVSTRRLDLTSNETQDSQSLPTFSPASFEGVESLENVASQSSHDLPQQEKLGCSFNSNLTNKVWKGSQSTRSDHEKVMPKDMISRQNLHNETSATAQLDEDSCNVNSKTEVSQQADPTALRNNTEKIKGSGFASVIKKSFKGFSISNHSADNIDRIVTVNGYKIPERLLKKAEKLAGPIHPGNYWYDLRAGFWGVVGGPCVGIIPPCIEEFNYPMQSNCSSGATGVFVNGRELQQIDLDLLSRRGLPTARGKSYLIEITGKVVDKDSGEELDGLGKLAPTIEKVKHGFGMKPRTQIVE